MPSEAVNLPTQKGRTAKEKNAPALQLTSYKITFPGHFNVSSGSSVI